MRIIALSLFVLALAYALYGGEKMTILAKISATVAVFGVAAGYSISFGPLVWLIVSEIFPSSIRGRALGASSICSYASAALVSYTFLTVQQTYGLAIPFAFYFLLTVLSIIFADIAIPETAGKTPKDIHLELERTWCIQ
jgi:MFS family permease